MRGALVVTGALHLATAAVAAPPQGAAVEDGAVLETPRADDSVVGETVIHGRREGPQRVRTDDLHEGAEALLGVPGVALARDGGPLAPSRPLVRGLGGARLGVDIAGVGFADPVSGDIDVALLPTGLGGAVVDVVGRRGLGGQLSLRPTAGNRVQLIVGELSTLQGSARLTAPVVGGRVTGAVSVGSTRGDFPFRLVDAGGGSSSGLVRDNNDQRRVDAAIVADVGGPTPTDALGGRLSAHIVATGAAHEGGVPGFATAPLALRGERARGAVGAVLGWRRGEHRVDVAVDALGDRRRVLDEQRVDEVTAGGGGAGVTLGSRVVGDADGAIDGDLVTRGAAVVVPGRAVRREGQVHLGLAGHRPVPGVGVVGASVGAGVGVVDDLDVATILDDGVAGATWLPAGRLVLDLTTGNARVALSVRHVARAPTLDERFAPAGFIKGNPDLAAERVTDVELRSTIDVEDQVSVDVAAFSSRLEDAIVLVNKNAFEVAPENTGPALRAGLELGLRARPAELILVEQAATLLWSEVEATGAPLPTAPPLSLRSRARLGTEEAWVSGTVTGRGSAPSTIFGTLGSGAFVLVDLAARVPLGDRVALTLAIDNAFDVQTARDQNLLPLPGRLAAIGLEVRP